MKKSPLSELFTWAMPQHPWYFKVTVTTYIDPTKNVFLSINDGPLKVRFLVGYISLENSNFM